MNSINIQTLWKDSPLCSKKLIDVELLNNLLVKYEQKIIDAVDTSNLWRLSCAALWLEGKTK